MKVFISWSRDRSKAVALALRTWLPQVIQALDPWMSSEDIGAGARWSPAIASQLEASSFGIICLTPENQAAEWLHFEAGAVAKSVAEGLVAPYLFELTEGQVKGPLSQFQMKRAEKDPTRELLRSINSQMKPPMGPEQLDRAFEKWWPDLQEMLSKIGPPKSKVPSKRPTDEMVEETLDLVRQLVRARPALVGRPLHRTPEQLLAQLLADLDRTALDNLQELERLRELLKGLPDGHDRDGVVKGIAESEERDNEQLPLALTPIYSTPKIDEPVPLYRGRIELRKDAGSNARANPQSTTVGDGRCLLDWLPVPAIDLQLRNVSWGLGLLGPATIRLADRHATADAMITRARYGGAAKPRRRRGHRGIGGGPPRAVGSRRPASGGAVSHSEFPLVHRRQHPRPERPQLPGCSRGSGRAAVAVDDRRTRPPIGVF